MKINVPVVPFCVFTGPDALMHVVWRLGKEQREEGSTYPPAMFAAIAICYGIDLAIEDHIANTPPAARRIALRRVVLELVARAPLTKRERKIIEGGPPRRTSGFDAVSAWLDARGASRFAFWAAMTLHVDCDGPDPRESSEGAAARDVVRAFAVSHGGMPPRGNGFWDALEAALAVAVNERLTAAATYGRGRCAA